jgi:hypothetical protein
MYDDVNNHGYNVTAVEIRLRKDIFEQPEKGETSWETRAARKIKKKVGNRTPKDRSKSPKTSWIISQKENPDRNQGAEI